MIIGVKKKLIQGNKIDHKSFDELNMNIGKHHVRFTNDYECILEKDNLTDSADVFDSMTVGFLCPICFNFLKIIPKM